MNLNFNFDGKTLLKNWWGVVKANFRKIQDTFNAHKADYDDFKADTYRNENSLSENYSKLSDSLNREITARTDGDSELGRRIDNLTIEMDGRNILLDMENYTSDVVTLTEDIHGVKYLMYYDNFDNKAYVTCAVNINEFAKRPVKPSKLVFNVGVAAKHFMAEGCDTFNNINTGESYLTLTYDDDTEKVVSFNGTNIAKQVKTIEMGSGSEEYDYYLISVDFSSEKAVKAMTVKLIADNFMLGGDTDGICEQTFFIDKLECCDYTGLVTPKEFEALQNKDMQLETQINGMGSRVSAAEQSISGLSTAVGTLSSQLETQIDGMGSRVSAAEQSISELSALLGTLNSELDAVNGMEETS